MDTIECILSRRSVRIFKDEQVKEEDINKIIECALYAPSGMNRQTWHFSVITNKKWLNEFSKVIGKIFNREGYNVTYGAPCLILVSEDSSNPLRIQNGSVAMENMMLAAHDLGLGTCWINQPIELNNNRSEKAKELLKEVGVNDDSFILCGLALGYVNGAYPALKARANNTVSFLK